MIVKRTVIETYDIDNYKQLMIGDEIELEDLVSKNAIFQVAHIDDNYLYLIRKYLLPHEFDRSISAFNGQLLHIEEDKQSVLIWLNTTYLNSLNCYKYINFVTIPYITNIYPSNNSDNISTEKLASQWDIFKQNSLVRYRLELVNNRLTEIPGDWGILDNIIGDGNYYISSIGEFINNNELVYPLEKIGILPCLMISLN